MSPGPSRTSSPGGRRRSAVLAAILLLAALRSPDARSAGQVIISEFMAANGRSLADDDKAFEDWIELRNVGTTPVDLSDWSLSGNARRPRQWIFPATNLPPDGHLLVWASGKDRRRVGSPLHANFRLSAAGEYLALRRPDGSVATEFAPAFPKQWPEASFGFLPGSTQAVFFVAPTPGKPNESTRQPPGPFVAALASSPNRPKPGQTLLVTARIRPAAAPVKEVKLAWRPGFDNERTLAMRPVGEDRWAVTLPAEALAPGRMIRWRLTATDETGGVAAYPLATDPRTTSKYEGTMVEAADIPSRLPVIHLFADPDDLDRIDSEEGGRVCAWYDGEFYDNVFVKVRGNTTAFFPKKSHRFEFPDDHPFRPPGNRPPVRHTSFMAEWGDPTYLRQHLSFWLQSETGSAAPYHDPVRLQLNGEFWQLAMHSEVLGEELLARHGLDPDGALYKAVGTLTPEMNSTGGFEKKTRRREGINDYLAVARALDSARNPDARRRALFRQWNVPAVINYLAVARLTQEDDDIWANLSLYHDNDGTDEWRPIPFDMNVSWGLSFATRGIQATQDGFRSHPFFGAAGIGFNQGHNSLYDAVVQLPETREMLVRRMRTILDHWWQPTGIPPGPSLLERHLVAMTNLIAADAALDRAKWGNSWNSPRGTIPANSLARGIEALREQFIEPRRKHFLVTHSGANTSSGRRVGVTQRDLAGIPPSQPPDVQLAFVERRVHPANRSLDYLALANPNDFAVDLSRWEITGRIRFTLPPGTVLPARGTLLLSPDVRALRAEKSKESALAPRFVVGDYRGRLTNAAPLTLRNDQGRTVVELDAGKP